MFALCGGDTAVSILVITTISCLQWATSCSAFSKYSHRSVCRCRRMSLYMLIVIYIHLQTCMAHFLHMDGHEKLLL